MDEKLFRRPPPPVPPLPLARFEALLEAYGSLPDRWPLSARAPAQALLQRSPAARVLMQQAARLDLALDALRPPPDFDDLRGHLVRQVPAAASAVPATGGYRRPLAAAALTYGGIALLGLVIGVAIAWPLRPDPAGLSRPLSAVAGPAAAPDLAALPLVDGWSLADDAPDVADLAAIPLD